MVRKNLVGKTFLIASKRNDASDIQAFNYLRISSYFNSTVLEHSSNSIRSVCSWFELTRVHGLDQYFASNLVEVFAALLILLARIP